MTKAHLRTAELTDIPGIWSLCSKYFDEYRGSSLDDFWDLCLYRWRDNPARTEAHPFGWVLENGRKEIVGFLGLVPMRIQVGNRVVTAASGTSWVVDLPYRSYGLDLYKRYMSWGDEHLLLDTTAGPLASQFHQRLKMGMRPIPYDNFHQKFIWVLSIRGIIRSPKKTILSLKNILSSKPYGNSNISVEQITMFEEEFDSFWNEIRGSFDVTVVRDRTYLTWRFLQKPKLSGRSFVFGCRNKGGDFLGYLVLQQGGYMNRPADHFVVTDTVCHVIPRANGSRDLYGYGEIISTLLSAAFTFAKEKKGTLFEAANFHPHLMTELKRFQPRVERIPHCTYWFKAPEGLKVELQEKAWWPSNADGDLNL